MCISGRSSSSLVKFTEKTDKNHESVVVVVCLNFKPNIAKTGTIMTTGGLT